MLTNFPEQLFTAMVQPLFDYGDMVCNVMTNLYNAFSAVFKSAEQ